MKGITALQTIGWYLFQKDEKTLKLSEQLINGLSELFDLEKSVKSNYECTMAHIHEGWREPNIKNRPSEVWQIRKPSYKRYLPSEFHELGEIAFEIVENILTSLEGVLKKVPTSNLLLSADKLFHSIQQGTITARFLKYDFAVPRQGILFDEHTDFGIASVFLHETLPGLELKQNSIWKKVDLSGKNYAFAYGDMMEYISGGTIPAVPHRVCAPQKARISVAYFLQPIDEFVLIDPQQEHLTTQEFFKRKFEQIFSLGKG